jgi:hypothetical protein
MNTTEPSVQVIIGLSGSRVESGGLGVSRERLTRIDVPVGFTGVDIALMQKDLEYMAQLAQQHPEAMLELGNAAARQDFDTARNVAKRIGLTEREFVARGGGKGGIVAAIVAALVVLEELLSADSGGDAPPPPPPPPPPRPDLDGGLPPGGVPQ